MGRGTVNKHDAVSQGGRLYTHLHHPFGRHMELNVWSEWVLIVYFVFSFFPCPLPLCAFSLLSF
jgi:hypothetical protein